MADLLVPAELHSPDFSMCSQFYGTGLRTFQCYEAADGLATGSYDILYSTVGDYLPRQYQLPISLNFGGYLSGCWISVEPSGSSVPSVIQFRPADIRRTAAAVIQRCVAGRSGIGGFATLGFSNLVNYLLPPNPGSLGMPFPGSTTFITVAVTGVQKKLTNPGETDPAIPAALADLELSGYKTADVNSAAKLSHEAGAFWWTETAASMQRGGSKTWLPAGSMASMQTTYDMAYECDASLGSPPEADCSQLEWSQLGPPSDTVSVAPGVATFVHSNSCYLAISASANLILTWQQIRAAVEALLVICVMQPFNSPQGGRAYYKVQSKTLQGWNKKRDVTGLNALPPHANITLFEQSEPWTNANDEVKSCSWHAVSSRTAVSTCK